MILIMVNADDINYKDLSTVYGKLGQVLDGLWYLEIEKKFGFDVAYEIDEKVWEIFGRKEAKRLKRFLGIEKCTPDDVIKIFKLSLFNQSLVFDIKQVNDDPITIRAIVTDCKTLRGMVSVGRPDDQIEKICRGIGIAFFKTMMEELVPGSVIKCVSCPHLEECDSIKDDSQVCTWDFVFPK